MKIAIHQLDAGFYQVAELILAPKNHMLFHQTGARRAGASLRSARILAATVGLAVEVSLPASCSRMMPKLPQWQIS